MASVDQTKAHNAHPVQPIVQRPSGFDSGRVTMVLSIVQLETDEEIDSREVTVHSRDVSSVIDLRSRVRRLLFEEPRTYLFAPVARTPDVGHKLAARLDRVYPAGASP
jgi:hypothetical protein